jgi:YwiC-like protein
MQLRRRLRLPKEHGAWAMLYVPFALGALAGLTTSPFSLATILLLLSVTLLFVARQSLFDWLIARGRATRDVSAFRTMSIYAGLSAIFGGLVIWFYHREWLVGFAALTFLLLAFNSWQVVRRKDRAIITEAIAIMGLTLTAPTSYYVTRGALDTKAWILWALCTLYFASSVFYVKLRVNSLNRRRNDLKRRSWRDCAVYHVFLLLALVALNATGNSNLCILAAFIPVIIRTVWHLRSPSSQISLRRVGLLEIAYSFVFLVLVTIGYRGL